MEKLQTLRGMVDLLPDQTGLWQHVEALAQEHFRRSGLQEIRTPVLEATQLFARGIGEATDVVGKEMYTFEDRSHRSCTLRPEGTAAVVRAAIQHGLLTQGPQRLWYGGPMFRYERPQAGRQRQFHQIGVELLGFSDPLADLEGIAVAWDLLTSLGLQGLTLEVNTLGTEDDRTHYRDQLVSFLQSHYDALDQDSQERLLRNPLRILDSKHPSTQALLAQAPSLDSVLSRHSQHRFRQVLDGLRALGIPHQVNPRLVRGLDYYSHTAFEITSTQLGAQATVCGGGRYDGLVSQLGGPSTASFGWALGMERLVLLLNHADNYQNPQPIPSLYVIHRGEVASLAALVLVRNLRLHGLHVELDPGGAAFSKQFKRADRSGAPWAAVLAEEEIAKDVVQLKPLRGQSDFSVQLPLGELSPLLDKLSQ